MLCTLDVWSQKFHGLTGHINIDALINPHNLLFFMIFYVLLVF
jgi:hypothetical protein